MSLSRDPAKLAEWKRRSAEKTQARAREKALAEGRFSSLAPSAAPLRKTALRKTSTAKNREQRRSPLHISQRL